MILNVRISLCDLIKLSIANQKNKIQTFKAIGRKF